MTWLALLWAACTFPEIRTGPVECARDADCTAGMLCRDDGACVECLTEGDCSSGDLCLASACAPPHCANGMQDLDETDPDCGGDACPRCGVGQGCAVDADCLEGGCVAMTCRKSCARSSDCGDVDAMFCDVGRCVPLQPCATDVECNSGHCSRDQICCDQACSSACTSCRAAHTGSTDGECAPIRAGLDPFEDCMDLPLMVDCDGTGKCELPL